MIKAAFHHGKQLFFVVANEKSSTFAPKSHTCSKNVVVY